MLGGGGVIVMHSILLTHGFGAAKQANPRKALLGLPTFTLFKIPHNSLIILVKVIIQI